jgi:polysaccharide biosynthesis transport protein
LPSLAPVVEVRASTMTIDAYVLVVEWGKTSTETVQCALASAHVHHKLLGAILNKTDLRSSAISVPRRRPFDLRRALRVIQNR